VRDLRRAGGLVDRVHLGSRAGIGPCAGINTGKTLAPQFRSQSLMCGVCRHAQATTSADTDIPKPTSGRTYNTISESTGWIFRVSTVPVSRHRDGSSDLALPPQTRLHLHVSVHKPNAVVYACVITRLALSLPCCGWTVPCHIHAVHCAHFGMDTETLGSRT
jgi:hypothetical protein